MAAGAHIARRAHLIASFSRIFACLVQFTRSGELNASKYTCSSYGAEYVGKIQYRFPKMTASGSAYHPSNTGFPARAGPAAITVIPTTTTHRHTPLAITNCIAKTSSQHPTTISVARHHNSEES